MELQILPSRMSAQTSLSVVKGVNSIYGKITVEISVSTFLEFKFSNIVYRQ